jgi:CRISPR-associated protein Cas2
MKVNGKDTVWSLIMFDLPVQTKTERREATQFRKLLVDNGYSMVQFSVYGKYSPTAHDSILIENFIKKHLPAHGEVRMLHLTDIQWAKAKRFISRKHSSNEETPGQLSIF